MGSRLWIMSRREIEDGEYWLGGSERETLGLMLERGCCDIRYEEALIA
jgi:hypothetical protein